MTAVSHSCVIQASDWSDKSHSGLWLAADWSDEDCLGCYLRSSCHDPFHHSPSLTKDITSASDWSAWGHVILTLASDWSESSSIWSHWSHCNSLIIVCPLVTMFDNIRTINNDAHWGEDMIVVKPNCFVIDFVPVLTNVHHNNAPVQVMTTPFWTQGPWAPSLSAGHRYVLMVALLVSELWNLKFVLIL